MSKWMENDDGLVELEIWSENAQDVFVGPGRIVASMPLSSTRPSGAAR